MDHLEAFYAADPRPTHADTNRAFWGACHGGQHTAAAYLKEHGADINWIPEWEPLTPLDAARRSEASTVVSWLETVGAHSATNPPDTADR